MMEDFFVTVGDGNGGEQTILIWVPLAITAYNVVLEFGGSQQVAEKASNAVIRYGRGVDYHRDLTVRRQVIMSARKAADAVIEDLGNGEVAAAVLDAVRVGGEILASAKASGIVIDAIMTREEAREPADGDNDSASSNSSNSNLINLTLTKPMGIVFEPVGDPHECGVRIRELPPCGKAYQTNELKVGDELLSINDKKVGKSTFYQILEIIEEEDEQKEFNLTFQRPCKKEMKAAMGRKFKNLMKRSSRTNIIKIVKQRSKSFSRDVNDASPTPTSPPQAQGSASVKSTKSFSFFGIWPSSSHESPTVPVTQPSKADSTHLNPLKCTESSGSLSSVMKLLGCAELYGQSSGHSLGSTSDYSSLADELDENDNALRGVAE
mmetsp:Transcript_28961/g.41389  ORF Transcript_28961/g.41389 Transcript_28961/m.41389 type:complete len:379 (+) Transcript_28961:88-1224(+)|eukprot:CAMPEP_0201712204 /NCGR_PEP_ID=MMETSP0578-20130828/59526_1 /ASSEMBLY_ACC=CAM_ASM_000663 /TAXON_ID=267565 /ORGANISM="Skeletonema grethea, Strain CCMP 1804" /LENGTH=378 /DNA_ID=CAMNT_0048201265 /DNA_START=18 /DNA_END=1154 /DNA_ORIENTATION=-